MKAIRIDGQTPGGARTKLAEVIPLSTPYVVQIFPVYGCNFKCNYCIHSVPKAQRGYISDKSLLDFELYKKCIDDMAEFPEKIKMLRFAGTGEPLLHKDIARMVEYVANKQVASSIDIVTNGALLTPKLSKELVSAGLTRLRISIQGLDALKYKNVASVDFDFCKFIENLAYVYQNRGSTQIYIKIIDCALEENEEEKFFEIFGDICDVIAIEHLLPAVSQINYRSISRRDNSRVTQNGAKIQEAEICPQPFYLMQINPDGNVVPCCAMETAYVAGNSNAESLCDIWKGSKYNAFRREQLLRQKGKYSVCRKCRQYKYAMFAEDVLDDDAERLLNYFK